MSHAQTVLVLQGGGALGAYQAGVYEGLAECGFAPDWVAGVSIGAINGALIAGNPPERRLERLREFWNRLSSGLPWNPLAELAPLRAGLNRFNAFAAALFGVPGFFSPRVPPALFAPDGTPGALSFYDTSPLRRTSSDDACRRTAEECWRDRTNEIRRRLRRRCTSSSSSSGMSSICFQMAGSLNRSRQSGSRY